MKKDSMKTTSPKRTPTPERCQHRTPKGRQCASRVLDPESSWCPRHSASQSTNSQNFSAELTENACDFQDPQGINHSLAALYKLLASGRISPRRATGLAYIASMLLRTLPGIREQIIETTDFSQFVPARGRVGCSEDEKPPILPEPASPAEDDPPGLAHRGHPSQQPAAQACLPGQACLSTQAPASVSPVPQSPPPNSHLPALPDPPPVVDSPAVAGPWFPAPVRSVPLFRRTHSLWKPRFDAAASRTVHRAYGPNVQLAPLQLRLARIHHSPGVKLIVLICSGVFLLQTLANVWLGEFVDRRDVLSLICEAV
jgi:hypothetical protein